ncbi:hypothetical protein FRC04_008833 [Tulasnella sp. 424]|nr:hypothetical protein FRC04_008833 [Tulasnella sp. 424]
MSNIMEFLDLIERRPEIKGWIKTFEMGELPLSENQNEQNQTVRDQYMATLPRVQGLVPDLKNLHTLRCYFSAFTPSLYSGILQLTKLGVLDLTLDNFDMEGVNMDHLLDVPVKPSICPVQKISLSGEIADSGATASAILAFIQLGTLTELKYWARTWPQPPSGITLFKAINEWIPDHVFVRLQCLKVVMPKSGAEVTLPHIVKCHRDGRKSRVLVSSNIIRTVADVTSSPGTMTDYTTLLPPETWLVVIEFLAASFPKFNAKEGASRNEGTVLKCSPYLSTVSALSWFFHQLANPYRFREVHVMVDTSTPRPPMQKISRIEELLDLIEHRPEIKMWIRVLSIGRSSIGLPEDGEGDKIGRYLIMEARIHKVVPELQNLSSLRCGFMSFSSSLFSGVVQLPQLERLELEDFQLDHDPSDHTPNWDATARNRSSLQTLIVKGVASSSAQTASAIVHLLQRETLVDLSYWPHLFPEIRGGISLFRIVLRQIPQYIFTGLQRLTFMLPPNDIEVGHFVQFGTQCPNVTSLTICWNFMDSPKQMEDRIMRGGLGDHHFPALEHFDGPFALAPIFARRRPVHTIITDPLSQFQVTSTGNETTTAVDIAALEPRVPLRVLYLVVWRWNEADIEAVAQHHPGLEELTYEWMGDERMYRMYLLASNLFRASLGLPA